MHVVDTAYPRQVAGADPWSAVQVGFWRELADLSLHDSDYNVCLPDLSDRDSDTEATPGETLSFESFIATCKLTLIVE